MMEWWQNDRHLRIQFFSAPPKTGSFLVIPSFQHHSVMPQMKRDDNYNGGDFIQESFQSFKLHSSQSCHPRNTEWWGMKGDFWTKAKALIQKITSFHCHSVIPCHCCILHRVIPFIWRPFLTFAGHSNSDVIPVPFCHLLIIRKRAFFDVQGMTLEWTGMG